MIKRIALRSTGTADQGSRPDYRCWSGYGQDVGVPVLSDVHEVEQVNGGRGGAGLCCKFRRFYVARTDLLLAAGAYRQKPVNVKKGPVFWRPWGHATRGSQNRQYRQSWDSSHRNAARRFGYNNLVADMRSLAIMRGFGYPVVFDATHSVQLPGGAGGASSGQTGNSSPALTRAAVGVGIDALFIEVHCRPRSGHPRTGPTC